MSTASILIVADEKIMAQGFEKRLKGLGYAVAGLASTGEEAIQKAMAIHPDLILMDTALGGSMDGVAAASALCGLMDVPVVFVTADADANAFQQAKITEPFGHVLKACEDKDLQAAIEVQLYKHKLDQLEHQLVEQRRQLEEANTRLEAQAIIDALTGLKNGRALKERLAEEVKRSCRFSTPLSLLLLDVDHFKQFNDRFSHPAGDSLLQGLARLLKKIARSTDFVARFDGEEFAIVLPNTDQWGSGVVGERIRRAIAQADERERRITVSVGAATLSASGSDSTLVEKADAALNQSKKSGWNCVHHANELESPAK